MHFVRISVSISPPTTFANTPVFSILFQQLAIDCTGVAGWYPYGAVGIVSMITTMNDITTQLWLFLLNLIMAVLWGLLGLVYIFIYINVLVVFRTQNHSFKKMKDLAQSEVTKGITKGVSSAVSTALTRDNQV